MGWSGGGWGWNGVLIYLPSFVFFCLSISYVFRSGSFSLSIYLLPSNIQYASSANNRLAERASERASERERERERERENSNTKTLFYKDCGLGVVKNLSNR